MNTTIDLKPPTTTCFVSPSLLGLLALALTLHMGCYVTTVPDATVPDGASELDGSVYLDEKQLASSGDNIVLDGGKYSITGVGSGEVRFSGSIVGPGEVRVALPQSLTLVFEGEVSQVRLAVESGTVDLTKAVDRSGEVSVTSTGILKRLANPIDISSSLRLWLDSSRVWTLYQDSYKTVPVTADGQDAGFWQSLDRWRGVAAVRNSSPGITYAGADGGVSFNQNSLSLPDIEIRNAYTIATVYRPISIVKNQSSCVLSSWGSSVSEVSLCYASFPSTNKYDLRVGSLATTWNYITSSLIDMVVDGTLSKFPEGIAVDNLVAATGDSSGTTLQFNGNQVASELYQFTPHDSISFAYYLGRSWDNAQFLNMGLKELVVTSDSKVADILTGYLAWHNGLQSQLVNAHPYKSAAPIAVINKSGTSVYGPCNEGQSCLVASQAACAPNCPNGERCVTSGDCSYGNCLDGKCSAPLCSPKCKDGALCASNDDCSSQLCRQGFCSTSTLCSPICGIGDSCASASDCASKNCLSNVCAPPACSPKCKTGASCNVAADCLSGICSIFVCSAPTCSPACPVGSRCSVGTECGSTVCQSNLCKSCAPFCGIGAACAANADCLSGACGRNNVCVPPACAPICPAGAKCFAATDCISGKCSASNLCESNACSPKCLTNTGCSSGSECISGICVYNVCAKPVCSPNCKTSDVCSGTQDCVSNVCENNVCSALGCWSAATRCIVGTKCFDNSHCASNKCQNYICTQ